MTEIKLIRDDDKATKILAAVAQIDAGAELAPVVRCKDCARGKEVVCMENARYCTRYREVFDGADFCSYGERRTNDGEI